MCCQIMKARNNQYSKESAWKHDINNEEINREWTQWKSTDTADCFILFETNDICARQWVCPMKLLIIFL